MYFVTPSQDASASDTNFDDPLSTFREEAILSQSRFIQLNKNVWKPIKKSRLLLAYCSLQTCSRCVEALSLRKVSEAKLKIMFLGADAILLVVPTVRPPPPTSRRRSSFLTESRSS